MISENRVLHEKNFLERKRSCIYQITFIFLYFSSLKCSQDFLHEIFHKKIKGTRKKFENTIMASRPSMKKNNFKHSWKKYICSVNRTQKQILKTSCACDFLLELKHVINSFFIITRTRFSVVNLFICIQFFAESTDEYFTDIFLHELIGYFLDHVLVPFIIDVFFGPDPVLYLCLS